MLEIKTEAGIPVLYSERNEEIAKAISGTFDEIIPLIEKLWGLKVPHNCRFYILDSMLNFVYHSSSWLKKVLLTIFFPLWYPRAKGIWKVSGGWTLRGRKNPACGVKTPEMIQKISESPDSMGKEIFNDVPDMVERAKNFACHEMVHAFSSHLLLPLWLNEGIAQVTVDKWRGETTVPDGSISYLNQENKGGKPSEYSDIKGKERQNLIYQFLRGYWLTRYIMETHPQLIRETMAKGKIGKAAEKTILNHLAQKMDFAVEEFWQKIDGVVVEYFK